MIISFIFAVFATLGFSIIFRVPLKHIPVASLIGGIGWLIYQVCLSFDTSSLWSCFFAACTVGILSDLSSRIFKEASTIFTIPGILPLVPGAAIYKTMLAIVSGDLSLAANLGSQTLLMAGSIAIALLVVGAMIRIIVSIACRATCISKK
ncbi:MAG: threonine/serine exporter family protein [Anaerovoracaceae bacterium]